MRLLPITVKTDVRKDRVYTANDVRPKYPSSITEADPKIACLHTQTTWCKSASPRQRRIREASRVCRGNCRCQLGLRDLRTCTQKRVCGLRQRTSIIVAPSHRSEAQRRHSCPVIPALIVVHPCRAVRQRNTMNSNKPSRARGSKVPIRI